MTMAHTPAGAASAAPAPARVDLARTWMLRSPLAGGLDTAADVLVLDLEDGLPSGRKAEGRERAHRAAADARHQREEGERHQRLPPLSRGERAGGREHREAGIVEPRCGGGEDGREHGCGLVWEAESGYGEQVLPGTGRWQPQADGGGSPPATPFVESPLRHALRARHLPVPGRIEVRHDAT